MSSYSMSLWAVRDFHDAHGIHEPDLPTMEPLTPEARDELASIRENLQGVTNLAWSLAAKRDCKSALRVQLIAEELTELVTAMLAEDATEALDALCDLRYVCDGTTLCLGLGTMFHDAFQEVHNSNMSKLGADGGPISDDAGRVVKGPNYRPPDIESIISEWCKAMPSNDNEPQT